MESDVNTGSRDLPIRGPACASGGLCGVGGVAAILAALVFRRNWSAEILLLRELGLFGAGPTIAPDGAAEWFGLLQSHPLIGLVMLNVLDLVNYALLALILLALYGALRRVNEGVSTIALASGLVGTAVAFASNQALAMLSLSRQYAATTNDAERTMLLAAAKALLVIDNPDGLQPSTGATISLLLVTLASVMMAVVMLRSGIFGRATAYVGLIAEGAQLAFFVVIAAAPALAALPPSVAGLFRLVWYLMIGRRLLQLAREPSRAYTLR